MPFEMKILAWTVCLGLVHIAVAASLGTQQRGLKWNVGNRDGETKPLTGIAARADRANRNFFETFPLFAAAILALAVQGSFDAHTVAYAQLYFWTRLAYLAIYLIGIPYLRTITWAASIVGLVLLLLRWLSL
jgi:uncharacterized MAPEG superfamily protein